MLISGEGRTQVSLEVLHIGNDVVLTLGGGDSPHVGGVVLKVPGEETRTLKHGIHRDLEVLVPLAEAASEKLDVTVVAVGGIHIANATKEEIEQVRANCRSLIDLLHSR